MIGKASIFSLFSSIKKNRSLIWQMTKRNIVGKYKGSLLGLLWSFLNPLVMLSIYTFAFSVVLGAKWGVADEGHADFALILFASLTVFMLFSEVFSTAPMLIINEPNFVKKVIFPLEILPVIGILTSMIHAGISLLIYSIAFFLTNYYLPATMLLLPIVLVPLLLLVLGVSFFLSSTAVFIRDIAYFSSHISTIFLYVSPVFYSLNRVPEKLKIFATLNPLAVILENTRAVMVFGQLPDWTALSLHYALGFATLMAGYWWFQKTRKGFADVL